MVLGTAAVLGRCAGDEGVRVYIGSVVEWEGGTARPVHPDERTTNRTA